jgi:hypothetical protein
VKGWFCAGLLAMFFCALPVSLASDEIVSVSLSAHSSHWAVETLPQSLKSLPQSDEIFTIAINPVPDARYFTAESLRNALPSFRPGKPEIKNGARRIWQSGVIVLKDKHVLFWTTCRKNFVYVLTPNGSASFIIGDGKDDL